MKTVALVEDTPDIVEMLSYALQSHGYECLPFSNGRDFLAALDSIQFDLLILDLMLPLVSGEDILREMEDRGKLSDLKLVIYSALVHPETIAQKFSITQVIVVKKPGKINDLLQAVKTMLGE
ncbi:MAG: response regulator [Candidatus Wallbacteria bacterium]|nr:response regulator [Candidatus Wallbacteria bacterium]